MDHFELVSEYEPTATSPRAIEQLVREFCEDNQNLLLNEAHPFHNQILHISGTFKEPEKANIDDAFTAKTAACIRMLRET